MMNLSLCPLLRRVLLTKASLLAALLICRKLLLCPLASPTGGTVDSGTASSDALAPAVDPWAG